jgi:Uma2 family endonuclease
VKEGNAMKKSLPVTPQALRKTKARVNGLTAQANGSTPREVRILDEITARSLIRERQERGIDRYDEVWDGVYVMPAMANLFHQDLVTALTSIFSELVVKEKRGRVQPGANVSDRRKNWGTNFRVPDVVVVLNQGRAVDCNTHWFGGPDFLVEVESRSGDAEDKIPFYSRIEVRELLIIHRDTRALRLYRHDGRGLIPVDLSLFEGKQWLVSQILPLAFRRKVVKKSPRTELVRTDGKPGYWTV